MKKGLIAILALLLIGAGIIVFWVIGIYNSLVTLDVNIDESWSQVEVQYQARADKIPNLVATVEGVADFEKSTYEAVTEARSAWANAQDSGDRTEQIIAANAFDSAISRLLVTVENYPQLKAQENFLTLQSQIEGIENRIAVSRRDYNQAVKPYNEKVRKFPVVFVAPMLGFDEEVFFESSEGSETAPVVDFDN